MSRLDAHVPIAASRRGRTSLVGHSLKAEWCVTSVPVPFGGGAAEILHPHGPLFPGIGPGRALE